MPAEYELTLNDYLSIIKRRWGQAVAVSIVILSVFILLAFLLPVAYESKGTILVEAQRIPEDLVQSTVTSYAAERIEVIKQRVMTRENLLRIIKKYNLYKKKIESKSTSELIEMVRQSININLLEANFNRGGGDQANISFTVGFLDEDPSVSQKVANELVTLFLDENVKSRNERAVETTEFLTEELNRLKSELEAVENKVADYKQQHENSLPEHTEMYMASIERTGTELKEVDRDYKSTQEELRYLDVELTTIKAGKDVKVAAITELDKARSELDRLLIIYKENHPTIRNLKRKIQTLEKTSTSVVDQPVKIDVSTDLAVAKIQTQIQAASARLNSLSEQKKSLQEKIYQLQNQVTKSPQVERGLFTLMRDYENAKNKYEEVKSKQVNAKIAQNLESENKAERFTLIEPPFFPDKPSKPNRKKMIGMGFAAALACAVAYMYLIDMLDKKVRGVEALSAISNMRPMVTIPYIYTQAQLERRKHLSRYIIIGVLVLVMVSLVIVHFLIMPIDLVYVKLMSKLG
jgi:polysaccharide biosynthesis transport protein